MPKRNKQPVQTGRWQRFTRSIWLFPAILTAALLLLTSLKIHGSSIGTYNDYFYGESRDDPALLLNKPRPIRSDEWLTNTQMTIAQDRNNYERINDNIGDGEDMSVILDVPYKGWSELFRPHNWVFFVLPFDYAFAFKWWIMGYLLILSAYFFVLALLPKKKLFAAVLASSLFFAPFLLWWYQYITLAPVYYCLMLMTVFVYMFGRHKKRLHSLALGGVAAYLLVCFALVLYPPFQLACLLPTAAFMAGYLLEKRRDIQPRELLMRLGLLAASGLVAGLIILAFLFTRSSAVKTIENTAYPGKRLSLSGGFEPAHFLAGNLAYQFQFTGKAAKYRVEGTPLNQSEASNFLPLAAMLFLPGIWLLADGWRWRRTVDWPLLAVSLMFLVMLVRLFVPHFNRLFNLLQLNRVPNKRLLIGVGLLGLIYVALIVRRLSTSNRFPAKRQTVILYALGLFCAELFIGRHVQDQSPGFISTSLLLLLSLPLPLTVYLLLDKKEAWAAGILLLFGAISTVGIHPLYRGTDIITKSPLSTSIRQLAAEEPGEWIAENIYLENYALLNGAPSMTGLYAYPQLELWRPIDNGSQQDIYNRYAHTDFTLINGPDPQTNDAALRLLSPDHFNVLSLTCANFLKTSGVRFYIAVTPLPDGGCAKPAKTIGYPERPVYIYRLDF